MHAQLDDVWRKDCNKKLTQQLTELVNERKVMFEPSITKVADMPVKGMLQTPIGQTLGLDQAAALKTAFIGKDKEIVNEIISKRISLLTRVKKMPVTLQSGILKSKL